MEKAEDFAMDATSCVMGGSGGVAHPEMDGKSHLWCLYVPVGMDMCLPTLLETMLPR